ncbi:unnamed protein product [Arctogadus glacialis]
MTFYPDHLRLGARALEGDGAAPNYNKRVDRGPTDRPLTFQRLDAIDLFVRRPGPSMEGRDGGWGGLWSHDIAGHGTCDAAIAGQSGTGMRVFCLAADRSGAV